MRVIKKKVSSFLTKFPFVFLCRQFPAAGFFFLVLNEYYLFFEYFK